MQIYHKYLVAILIVQILVSAEGCIYKNFTLDCSHRNYGSFSFDHDPTLVKVLRLNNNRLRNVPSNIKGFSNLEELHLEYNLITEIGNDAFIGLEQLKYLDVSFNKVKLSNRTISRQVFQAISSLRILKMKQNEYPESGFDYACLSPLKDSLEELYMTGVQNLSTEFLEFSKLHTLSLGGTHCKVPVLTNSSMVSLSRLPLHRLSARNCMIIELDSIFLQNFETTLQKLDLSCNPLNSFLSDIFDGITRSRLKVLLLDHINYSDFPCTWENVTNDKLKLLKNVPLEIWSFQANFLIINESTSLLDNVPKLLYWDVSQNTFGGATFPIDGDDQDVITNVIFHNVLWQVPSLRFIGLDGLTRDLECGSYIPDILNCADDSGLFLNENFAWNQVKDSNVMDFTFLTRMMRYIYEIAIDKGKPLTICYNEDSSMIDLLKCFCLMVASITKQHYLSQRELLIICLEYIVQQKNVTIGSPKSINHTLDLIHLESIQDIAKLLDDTRFILSNLTTLSVRFNDWCGKTCSNSKPCHVRTVFPNNLQLLDLSDSNLSNLPCLNYKGLKYLKTLNCKNCQLAGWPSDLFSYFPLTSLDMTSNYLSDALKNDRNGTLLGSAHLLERLCLGEQKPSAGTNGLTYFSDRNIFSFHKNLTYLDLHGNQLVFWNVSLKENIHISVLNLSNNLISYIEPEYREELDFLADINPELVLDLSLNDVNCDCKSEDSKGYMDWLLKSKVTVNKDKMKCKNSNVMLLDYACKSDDDKLNVIAISIVSCSIVLGIAIALALAIRRFIRKRRIGRHQVPDISVYASFPSSLSAKLTGIIDTLGSIGITVKSRETDVYPGEMVKSKIASLIASSTKIAVFLTSDWYKDSLMKFEVEIVRKKGTESVILVTTKADEPRVEELPEEFIEILERRGYIEWEDPCLGGNTSKSFTQTLINRLIQTR